LLSSARLARLQLFRSGDGFSTVKGILEDLFRGEFSDGPAYEPFTQRIGANDDFDDPDLDPVKGKGKLPELRTKSASSSEQTLSRTKGVVESDDRRSDKISVFRLALEITVLALRDERNRRWFDVSSAVLLCDWRQTDAMCGRRNT
jgi:hypothetical protein